jgi:hypothetical protein
LSEPLGLQNIRACAAASLAAYASPTVTDPATGESVFIQDCGGAVVIAFPGTHDLPDVLRDIQCFREAALILGKPCSVHRGFARSHAALMPCLADLSIIRAKPIFITGHSKGAAVAKRCALSLVEKNLLVTAVITFGEPRGGDSRYSQIYNSILSQRTLRVTNAADPVPWLPSWLAGNRHCGPEAWLPPLMQYATRNTQLFYGPRLWWELLCNAREIYQSIQLKNLAPLGDHHIATYIQRVNALF